MKKNFTKHILTFAVAVAAIVGIEGYTPKAEECVEETVATDTDAEVVVEDLNVEEDESSGRDVPYYNININGGSWDGNKYVVNGTTISDVFFCDGTYTYYLQYDGTPMKNRLTYHPDGKHVIYFDENGREVFSDFAMVKKSISGEAVDDMCFFDVYGHMYVNQLTYDKTGTKIYYVNEYGVIERNGWFHFPSEIDYFGEVDKKVEGFSSGYGYANADGTLMTNQFTYNQYDQLVYLCGDGMSIGEGIHNLGGTYYLFNEFGEVVEQYAQIEAGYTYTMTENYGDRGKCIKTYVYDGTYNNCISVDYYYDTFSSHTDYTYDDRGNELTYYFEANEGTYRISSKKYNSKDQMIYQYHKDNENEEKITTYYEANYEYYASGRISHSLETHYDENDVITDIWECYYSDDKRYDRVVDYKWTIYVDGKKSEYCEGHLTETPSSITYSNTLDIVYDTTTGEELYRKP